MNKYIAFYNGKQIEVEAETSFKAQCEASKRFKAKKPYMVTVVLCELADGSEVTHSTASVG